MADWASTTPACRPLEGYVGLHAPGNRPKGSSVRPRRPAVQGLRWTRRRPRPAPTRHPTRYSTVTGPGAAWRQAQVPASAQCYKPDRAVRPVAEAAAKATATASPRRSCGTSRTGPTGCRRRVRRQEVQPTPAAVPHILLAAYLAIKETEPGGEDPHRRDRARGQTQQEERSDGAAALLPLAGLRRRQRSTGPATRATRFEQRPRTASPHHPHNKHLAPTVATPNPDDPGSADPWRAEGTLDVTQNTAA